MTVDRLTILLVAAMTLAGCNSAYDAKIPSDPKTWTSNEALKGSIQKLKQEDKELLAQWMMRAAMGSVFGGDIADDMTIKRALESQRKWKAERAEKDAAEAREQAEREKVAAEAKARREAARQVMVDVLSGALTSIRFVESDWQRRRYKDVFAMTLAFKNGSPKDLAGVKGQVMLVDMFGDELQSFNLSIDEPIAAQSSFEWSGSINYNQFKSEDQKLRGTNPDKVRMKWMPLLYIFTDGSRMEVPADET